jgi:hypothetical protein
LKTQVSATISELHRAADELNDVAKTSSDERGFIKAHDAGRAISGGSESCAKQSGPLVAGSDMVHEQTRPKQQSKELKEILLSSR